MPRNFHYKTGLMRPHDSKINALIRLIDSALIFGVLWATCVNFNAVWTDQFVWIGMIAIGLFQLAAEYNEVYYSWRGPTLREELSNLLKTWLVTGFCLSLLNFRADLSSPLIRDIFLVWLLSTPFILLLWRAFVQLALQLLRKKGYSQRTVAFVGATVLGTRLEKIIKQTPSLGLKFLGYYDDRVSDDGRRLSDEEIQHIGDLNNLVQDAKNGTIDVLYIVLPMRAEKRIRKLVKELSDSTASVYLVPDLFMFDLLQSRWTTLQGIATVSIYETPFYGIDGLIKRCSDILLSLMILGLIVFPMILIAIGVKLTSPGPIIFTQWRYGVRGLKFKIYKFRTMRVDNNESNVIQATRNDPRTTPLGAFLRRASLDELPQFFNVLQGNMSIVGPRPHAIPHNEYYRGYVFGYMLRHKVKPGITGLAQVNGFRGETDTMDKMENRVKYDLEYIRNWSLLMDIRIIFLTVYKGFFAENAF